MAKRRIKIDAQAEIEALRSKSAELREAMKNYRWSSEPEEEAYGTEECTRSRRPPASAKLGDYGASAPRRTAIGKCSDDRTRRDNGGNGWTAMRHGGAIEDEIIRREEVARLGYVLRMFFAFADAQAPWEAVALCVLGDMSQRQAARFLGVDHTSVRDRIAWAGSAVRRCLDESRCARKILSRVAPNIVETWAVNEIVEPLGG